MNSPNSIRALQNNAKKRRRTLEQKVNSAIEKLLQEKKYIDFPVVAELANVSLSSLYRQPRIKAYIQQLKQQTNPFLERNALASSLPGEVSCHYSNESNNYQLLLSRIEHLEKENKVLISQIQQLQQDSLKDCTTSDTASYPWGGCQ